MQVRRGASVAMANMAIDRDNVKIIYTYQVFKVNDGAFIPLLIATSELRLFCKEIQMAYICAKLV